MNSSQVTFTPEKFLSFLSRLCVWGVLFAIVYFLRSFFLLMFLTFVFSYIQSQAVDRLADRIRSRVARVTLVGIVFLSAVIAVGFFLVPPIREQGKIFANNFPLYVKMLDREFDALSERYTFLQDLLPELRHDREDPDSGGERRSPTAALLPKMFGLGETSAGGENVKATLDVIRNIGVYLLAVGSAFLLSLLFSFLIVLDLPQLTEKVTSLAKSRLSFVYHEVAPSIRTFGQVLGMALEAQFFIALLNTFLTAIGLWILGLTENMAFFSMIVFFCSFIPLAGVFISSVPICLVALQVSGFGLMMLAILLITVIHLIEAYILNPKIFGHHLRMNPFLVLIILTLGGKLFGVWGLVLGLPICNYIFKHAIQYNAEPRAASA